MYHSLQFHVQIKKKKLTSTGKLHLVVESFHMLALANLFQILYNQNSQQRFSGVSEAKENNYSTSVLYFLSFFLKVRNEFQNFRCILRNYEFIITR